MPAGQVKLNRAPPLAQSLDPRLDGGTAEARRLTLNTEIYASATIVAPIILGCLRVIFRLDRDRVEESMKFGTKNLVGIRNKFRLGAT